MLLNPIKVLANTTVASPSSNAQGVVNNNATMITPSSLPQNRYSQGIICTSPSVTVTPYLTDAWSFNRPIQTVTRQNIYDEDTGEILYVQETLITPGLDTVTNITRTITTSQTSETTSTFGQ